MFKFRKIIIENGIAIYVMILLKCSFFSIKQGQSIDLSMYYSMIVSLNNAFIGRTNFIHTLVILNYVC